MKKQAKRLASDTAALIGQSLWTIFGFGLAVYIIAISFGGWIKDNSDKLDVIFTVNAFGYVMAALITVGVMAFIKREDWAKTKQLLALNSAKWTKFLKVLAVFIAYIVTSQVVYALAKLFLSGYIDFSGKQDLGFDASSIVQPYQYIVVFVMLVILPPMFEEILFRGYLYGRLSRRFGFVLSAVVTSLVFGLIHGSWTVGIDVFVLSMFLCYLRRDSASILPGMLLHGLKNGLAFFLLFIGPLIGIHV